MSSYGSTHSGYLHPSQYQQHPQQHQQHQQQPPYPTTPGPPTVSHPQAFYPPTPQQPIYSTSPQQPYSTSPTSQYQQPFYSSSPQQTAAMVTMPQAPQHRRSSSLSPQQRPQFAQITSAPITIPQPQHQAPVYTRRPSHTSHQSYHSPHMHDPHAYADGEDKNEHGHGNEWGLDEDTLRQYEKRYAKDRELEKRPTLGGSLMSMVRALGGKKE